MPCSHHGSPPNLTCEVRHAEKHPRGAFREPPDERKKTANIVDFLRQRALEERTGANGELADFERIRSLNFALQYVVARRKGERCDPQVNLLNDGSYTSADFMLAVKLWQIARQVHLRVQNSLVET